MLRFVARSLALALALTSVGPASHAAEPDSATRALAAMGEGAVARRDGHLVRACGHFRRAVTLTPTWGLAHFELGRCLRLIGDIGPLASAHLAKAIESQPARAVIHIEVARLAEDRGDRAAARREYAVARRLVPADVRPLEAAARVGGDDAPALSGLRELIRRQPMNLAAWRSLAARAEAQGELEEAEGALSRVLELSGNPTRAAAELGRFGARTGRASAVAAARKALGL